ncbi:MAG: hypothetical protein LBV59_08290 [Sphingobacterium sp.]|uniref:hypothetical protein n=1 Tax=Sphingobacterium sp. TaxID=341027 RepID=UPI00284C1D0E|nr:hypothetical protein [Sphingobacterium sp.]MDR3007914.1 hypothetical protein [Sphingobacterium sp.]
MENKGYSQENRYRINFSTGISIENLDWNISGNEFGESPNIQSELIFQNITSQKYGVELYAIRMKNSYKASFNLNIQRKGTIFDTDYLYDDRQGGYNYEHYSINKGTGIELKIGYQRKILQLPKMALSIGPTLQYKTSNFPIIDRDIGLDSYYQYSNSNLGFELSLKHFKKLNFEISNTFLISKLKAEGYWNLRQDFLNPSFKQGDVGYANSAKFNISYPVSFFSLGTSLSYDFARFKNGFDRTYTTTNVYKTRLNNLKASIFCAEIILSKQF